MPNGEIERAARAAGALLVAPRVLRRVIKRHNRLPGFGLDVPHAASYTLAREALAALCDARDLGCDPKALPREVVLLPRTEHEDAPDAHERLWRALYHCAIHRELHAKL